MKKSGTQKRTFELTTRGRFSPSASRRFTAAVVALLLAVQSGLLAYSAYVHSPTLNEPAHLAAGISHWRLGEFRLYRVNPPLVRMVAALPALAAGVETDWRRLHRDAGVRWDFAVGDDLIAANGERSYFLLMVARWACIPFAWIGGVVCFLWARALYGVPAGFVALTLWCFSPNILAHGSLMTPDVPATALGLLACYLFWGWLRRPAWRRVILAGAALGAAELAKATWIVLYPVLPSLWVYYRSSGRAKARALGRSREGTMLFVCLAAAVVITNLGYGFDGSFTRLDQFRFVSKAFSGRDSYASGNRFTGTWWGSIPVPLPRDYVLGIDVQRHEFEHFGRPSYLAGEFKETGWWYYYLYALAIKVPLGVWGLLFLTTASRLRGRGGALPPYSPRDELVLVLPALLILTVVSSQTGFSEHLRYVLPIAPFAFVWVSQAVGVSPGPLGGSTQPSLSRPREGPTALPARRRRWRTVVTAGLLSWCVGASLSVYPHSLSYFNELVGGPTGGHAYLLGSNADWGQDLRYLKWWLSTHPGARPFYLAYCGRGDPRHLGIRRFGPPPPVGSPARSHKLKPGWYAISVNFLRGYPRFAADGRGGYVFYERNALSHFLKLRPVAIAGGSIYIFHIDT